MFTSRKCPKCGAPLLEDFSGGCPACALRGALALSAAPTAAVAVMAEQPSDRIGRYKLLQKIGEGGMGTVWMAEQEEPIRRRVALKIIKLGMDTKEVIGRFEAERQALALMDHPNIARVLDAGATENGRPYFVMELVKGIPITRYCDENKLGTEERLKLFTDVCHAIQHAHQKGIIHRDLKPSNILVTHNDGVPMPKVIDFGIAKATGGQTLTDKTVFTAFEQFLGTPAYMSPEQAEMNALDVDTRSDIYALGVLLYELLTGKTPFEAKELLAKGLDEIRRIIREEEPPRPSTRISTLDAAEQTILAGQRQCEPPQLRGRIRGDLDWIVMKCLEKDRSRRYDTIGGLAIDIGRHLAGKPVTAGAPGMAYRAGKFIRRHRYGIATASAIVLLLLVGVVVSTSLAVRAIKAEAQTKRQLQLTEQEKERAQAAERQANAAKQEALKQQAAADYQSYLADITSAQAMLHSGETSQAKQFLSACPERFRNWEWQYLRANCDQSVQVFTGPAKVRSAAYRPDGSQVVTGCADGSLKILDAMTGKTVLELRGHQSSVGSVAYSPDGKYLASAAGARERDNSREVVEDKQAARIWNASTGMQLALLRHQARVNSIAWSPNGKQVVTAAGVWGTDNDNSARVWDAGTGQLVLTLAANHGAVVSAAFSPDGKRIVTGEWWSTGRVWDAASGKQLLTFDGGPAEVLPCVAFSPDGTRIIAGSSSSRTVHVWDSATGKELIALHGHNIDVITAVFSHDGLSIASGGAWGDGLRLWEAATGRLSHLFCGDVGGFDTVAFSPDDSRLLTASEDGKCRVWNADACWSFPVLRGHQGSVCSAAFSPDDRRIVTACSNWENGSDNSARIYDASTGRLITVLQGHAASVNSAEYSADGRRIVTASSDQTARVWDAGTGEQLLVLRGHAKDVSHASFSPDGKKIVTSSGGWYCGFSDHTIRIWDAATGGELVGFTTPETETHCVAFSPDATRIAIATGWWTKPNTCSAQILDATTGKPTVILRGHTDKVFSIAWNSDGSRLVTAGWDESARVWDPVTGQELLKLQGHEGWVNSAAFSSDGSRIVTASSDHTVRIWDASTGAQLLVLREHLNHVYSAQFSHDGTRIVTASKDGTARVWDSVPLQLRYRELLAK